MIARCGSSGSWTGGEELSIELGEEVLALFGSTGDILRLDQAGHARSYPGGVSGAESLRGRGGGVCRIGSGLSRRGEEERQRTRGVRVGVVIHLRWS